MKRTGMVLMCVFTMMWACSSNGEQKKESGKPRVKNPDAFAEAAFNLYNQSIISLFELVGSKPEITEELREKVAKHKAATIDEMVKLGHARAKMNEEDQRSCSARLERKTAQVSREPWNGVMNDAVPHYRKIDRAFADELASFNIITQYSQFELLKKQLPSEAQRLGIE